jgi:DDE superfamily endonuclease/Methyltransferase domain
LESISRFLHHLNLRFKKKPRAAEQDRPDVAAARKALQKRQPRLDPKRLVFIDETSVFTTITRLHGRAPQGERLVQTVRYGNWKTVTFIAALRHDRVTAPLVLEGPMTGEMFKAYTEQFLVSTLKRGDIVFMEVNLNGERSKGHGCAHLGRWYILRHAHGFVLPERSRVGPPRRLCSSCRKGRTRHRSVAARWRPRFRRPILDAGCGSGLLARTLRIEGFAVLGVDASAAMIELARRYEPDAQFEVVRLPREWTEHCRRATPWYQPATC